MTGMLASVANLAEAQLVRDAAVDIIDLKNPRAGALGALPPDEVRLIVEQLGSPIPISATIGDLPMEPCQVTSAVTAMAATGVDYIKLGFFPGGDWIGTIQGLSRLGQTGMRLIAVLFGDLQPDLSLLAQLAQAGFTGCMLDTLNKANGSLAQVCPPSYLNEFVAQSRKHALLCGLAGALREADIPQLLGLAPNYLGFRGGLCRAHERTGELDEMQIHAIRAMIV